jgi:hypothetical protein
MRHRGEVIVVPEEQEEAAGWIYSRGVGGTRCSGRVQVTERTGGSTRAHSVGTVTECLNT